MVADPGEPFASALHREVVELDGGQLGMKGPSPDRVVFAISGAERCLQLIKIIEALNTAARHAPSRDRPSVRCQKAWLLAFLTPAGRLRRLEIARVSVALAAGCGALARISPRLYASAMKSYCPIKTSGRATTPERLDELAHGSADS